MLLPALPPLPSLHRVRARLPSRQLPGEILIDLDARAHWPLSRWSGRSVVDRFRRKFQRGFDVAARDLRPGVESPSATLPTITLTSTRVLLMHGSP